MQKNSYSQKLLSNIALAAVLTTVFFGSIAHLRAQSASPFKPGTTLTEARTGFETKLLRKDHEADAPDAPPSDIFNLVHYDSSVGQLAAYISASPKDQAKHPAIIWLVGGFSNSIGDTAWAPAKPDNDQSASAFRKAGLIMMYPSLRGGNKNPGFKECCYGEVDDVIDAADYLAKQSFVDPQRIYLGGHSTGGTLALLVAEKSDRFRAVISLGPVAGIGTYGKAALPFDLTDKRELYLRSPLLFMSAIHTRTLVLEGDQLPGNISSLKLMAKYSKNPQITFQPIPGLTHFSHLAASTKLLADKLVKDTGTKVDLSITEEELNGVAASQKAK